MRADSREAKMSEVRLSPVQVTADHILSTGILRSHTERIIILRAAILSADTLRANDQVGAIGLDLTPDDWISLGWKTAKVDQLAGLGDFGESCAVGLPFDKC